MERGQTLIWPAFNARRNMLSELKSPRLAELEKRIQLGRDAALEAFWREQACAGTPLIEPLEDGKNCLVTFVFRMEVPGNPALLLGCPANLDAIDNPMSRLKGTDLWYLTYILPRDLRTTYGYFPYAPKLPPDFKDNPDYQLLHRFFTEMQTKVASDPLNPKTYAIPKNVWLNPKEITLSVLELPDASPQRLVYSSPETPKGQVHEQSFRSSILKNERDVWFYRPAGDFQKMQTMGLLVLFDGVAYTSLVSAPAILDNLIHERLIPPTMAILIDNPDDETRDRELGCNPLMPRFFLEELIPYAKEKYSVAFEPSKTVVAGSSFGGLGAFYFGLDSPHVFTNVLSMSGYLGWGHELQRQDMWIIEQYSKSSALPRKIYFDVGILETGPPTFDRRPSFIEANRRMETVLKDKGIPHLFVEYSGGHDYLCWQKSLADGLQFLLQK